MVKKETKNEKMSKKREKKAKEIKERKIDDDKKVDNETEEEKVEQGETKKKNLDKQNRQMKIIIFLMIVTISLITVVPFATNYVVKNYVNKFEFINLDFQKTSVGKLIYYSAEVPVVDEYGQIYKFYTIRFINDPRKIYDLEVDARVQKEGGIGFIKRNKVYISLDPDMNQCPDNGVAMFALANFLADSGLTVKSAMTDEQAANETGVPYADCQHSSKNTVIKVSSGDKNFIDQERANCYNLIYKECDTNKVTEKFALQVLEEYMRSFKKID